MKKFLTFVLVLAMILSVSSFAMAAEFNAASVSDIKTALNYDDTNINIELSGNIVLDEKLTINKNVTISGGGITRADSYTGTLFEVQSGATLTLDGGLVIDGGNNWTFNKTQYESDLNNQISVETGFNSYVTAEVGAPIATAAMFKVQGDVVLNNATIQNHMGNANQRLFYLNDTSSLALNNGAKITHCATAGKATVAYLDSANSSLTMEAGALITDNYGSQHAALIRCEKGEFTMNGGEISGNYGAASNGSVLVMRNGSTFTMKDGLIKNNSSVIGTGGGNTPCIMLYNGAKMYMQGGEISENTGFVTGGILAQNGAILIISGGKVVDNAAKNEQYAAYNDIYGSDTTTINGGVFTQDVTQWLGEDVEQVKGSDDKYYVGDDMENAPAPAPAPTKPARDSIKVTYNGGNSFSTSKSAVPTSVEIDGVPVAFNGNGKSFTVGCIDPNAEWVTVRWNSTSVTVNFKPDASVVCAEVAIPKTGDMPVWAAVAAFFGF